MSKKILSFLANLRVLVFCVLAAVFLVVNINGFYSRQYRKLEIDKATGMSFEDLDETTRVLLDYLNGKRDDLDIVVEKDGVAEQAFYDREILHMVDVKNLYINAQNVMKLSLLAAVLCFAGLWRRCKELGGFMRCAVEGFNKRLLAFVLFFAFMGGAMVINFEVFWTTFHHIFFTNDLWLLDPRYSTMINMLPEPLFFAMCISILIVFGLMFGLYSVLLLHTAKITPMPLKDE